MNADPLFPEGYHPVKHEWDPTLERVVTPLPRSSAPIKYYFIDFGLSVYVKDRKCTVLVLGSEGHDRDPPELHQGNRIPYDPYKLDVYLIGNVFRRILLDVSTRPRLGMNPAKP